MSFDAPPIDSTLSLSSELHRLGLTHAGTTLSALSRGDIHETRRVLKRLRAVLCLADGDRMASKADKALRNVGRMLSTTRDLEVSRELLPSFTGHLSTREEQQLNALLDPAAQRHTAIERALPILHNVCLDLYEWQPEADWGTLGKAVARSYRLAMSRLKECRDHARAARKPPKGNTQKIKPLSEPLHEMRKELKRLSHQLCLLPAESGEEPSPEVSPEPSPSWLERKKAEVRRASQLLGQEHDLHIFQERLGSHARLVLPILGPRRSVLQNEAIESAAHFLRKKPGAFYRRLETHLARIQERASREISCSP